MIIQAAVWELTEEKHTRQGDSGQGQQCIKGDREELSVHGSKGDGKEESV